MNEPLIFQIVFIVILTTAEILGFYEQLKGEA